MSLSDWRVLRCDPASSMRRGRPGPSTEGRTGGTLTSAVRSSRGALVGDGVVPSPAWRQERVLCELTSALRDARVRLVRGGREALVACRGLARTVAGCDLAACLVVWVG